MGIPSYFSYIIKTHSNIIRNTAYLRKNAKTVFHSLYMDCNSIIYDAVRSIETEHANVSDQEIIQAVIRKIWEYIRLISPTKVVYITFDGVAPFAKMEQQRARRYKTAFLSSISFDAQAVRETTKWNTSAITPGTPFMRELSRQVRREFEGKPASVFQPRILVSASDEPGEGEHKMYDYMRGNTDPHETIAVYGLDSDLIMLSIFHLYLCRNIYICREAPEFSKRILPSDLKFAENELLFMDMEKLSNAILNEMNCPYSDKARIYDYVFLCFFLGNDFLPHFPALNIRTHGIQQLLDLYSTHLGKYPDRYFIGKERGRIQWKWVHLFLAETSKMEESFLLTEYRQRAKLQMRKYSEKSPADREMVFQNTPQLYRGDEEYICPSEKNWEERYYRVAFSCERTPENISRICRNYVEGLEWVFRYYTEGCPDWRWKYHFHYPPLIVDLAKHIPREAGGSLFPEKRGAGGPYTELDQLCYVLPKGGAGLLPPELQRKLEAKLGDQKPEVGDIQFQWMFSKYFWESKVILPEIPMERIEGIVREYSRETAERERGKP